MPVDNFCGGAPDLPTMGDEDPAVHCRSRWAIRRFTSRKRPTPASPSGGYGTERCDVPSRGIRLPERRDGH